MGRIQSNIGLVTGMPIGATVDQLMELAAKPRDMLATRTTTLQNEQIAVTELSALLLSVQFVTDNLGKDELFERRAVSSSNDGVLSATLTGTPPLGTYQFTPVRMAQHHQLLSSGFASDQESLGGGKVTLRYGDDVKRNALLESFGAGQGASRGMIRITDRSGANAEIDLTTIQTVEDVLETINGNTTINITAQAQGDRIRLIDNTGQTVSNLMVQEVGGGSTAASLGLADINTAATQVDGKDMLRINRGTELASLNDGNGVLISAVLPDLDYELRDGTRGVIDFSPIQSGSSEVNRETTLGEFLDIINEQQPDKLRVEIAPDGDRLIVTDLTEGDGDFRFESLYESDAAEDLGLGGEAVDGVIVGKRILGGMQSVLVSSLNGGKGFGTLGAIELTDRRGETNTIDLSNAETLDDVVEAINTAGVGIVARVNDAKNGIQLTDVTGRHAGNMIVADADGTNTATNLGIAVDDDVVTVNSGDMHLQVVSHETRLDSLNGGQGVTQGRVTLYDSKGHQDWLVVDDDTQTIGDVILAINRLDLQVYAEINAAGDGIRIRDTAGGEGSIQAYEANSTTAADLHLLGGQTEVEIDGQTTKILNGATTFTVELDADDSLDDLRVKINELSAGVTAMTFIDGSSEPYRLSLTAEQSGKGGRMVVDISGIEGFSMAETAKARDALLVLGSPGTSASNVLISSATNKFKGVISGVTLDVKQPSNTPVTISVETSDADLVANIETMVTNYNRFRERLQELTVYNVDTNEKSLLTGDSTALRLDTELSYFFSSRFIGTGSIQSLGEIGIDMRDDGTLQFNSADLKSKFADDPDAVKRFLAGNDTGLSANLKSLVDDEPDKVRSFLAGETVLGISDTMRAELTSNRAAVTKHMSGSGLGLSSKFAKMIEQLSGPDTSLLANRFLTLNSRIKQNEEKITWLDERLLRQRESMLTEFYRMEMAIGKMQNNMSAVGMIQPLTPLTARYE